MQGSAEGTVRNLERVRYVTENYEVLKGLKRVPVGLMNIALGVLLWVLQVVDIPRAPEDTYGRWAVALVFNSLFYLLILLLIAALVLSFVFNDYYERRFGKVERRRFDRRRILIGATVVAGCLVAYGVDLAVRPPLRLGWLALGVVMIAHAWPKRRFRAHYIVMSALLVAASFLPLLGIPLGDTLQGYSAFIVAFSGLQFVVGGIFDHLLLVRTMKSLPEEDDGGAV